uniref:Uncharacterized protein n=1 Tax=Spyridia filamentosa TaxID=196632 RepID=A0A1Z1MJT0_SPYFI|nr:hypothetical protein [Spyridia filamentosa]ARW66149.1 hypothetical protein [Spyridia filamentosa]
MQEFFSPKLSISLKNNFIG